MVDSSCVLYPAAVLEHHTMIEDTVRPLQRFEDESSSFFDASRNEKKEAGGTPPPKAVVFSERVTAPQQQKQQQPPMPRPTRLSRRSVSEPAGGRRAIFGQFWDKPTTNNRPRSNSSGVVPGGITSSSNAISNTNAYFPPTPPPAPRQRVSSISIPHRLSPTTRPEIDIVQRQFSTPSALQRSLSREHFKNLRELSLKTRSLPTVPLPLSRFCDEEGNIASMSGAYPLISPRSILRQSSYRTLTDNDRDSLSLPDVARKAPSFNLTESVHINEDELAKELDSDTSSTQDGTVSNCSSHSGRRRVQFDPRITVTEYADNYERIWFSDDDLERFKTETICLAQQYLLKHPDMIARYNKPVLDPVTGTMRKRALFSLPAFNDTSSDDDEGELQCLLNRLDAKRLADAEVKKIMIVDRNRLILDLFRRSLRTLFPHAAIACYQSAEEALQSLDSVSSDGVERGFDIVVAEERLHQPLAGPGKNMCSGKTTDSLPLYVSHQGKGEGLSHAWKSLSNISSKPIPVTDPLLSGTQLFQKIARTDNKSSDSIKTSSAVKSNSIKTTIASSSAAVLDASSLVTSSIKWQPLLIGVSTRPQQDSNLFLANGADLVWGKPPPTMNECLRDHLVAALLKKRRRSVHQRSCE